MALFESYERRIDKITSVLNSYGIASIEEAEKITKDAGLDVYAMVKGIQPICFENACWAYTVGAAIAIKKGARKASEAAAAIAELNGTEFGGRQINVTEAKPMAPRENNSRRY